MKKTSVEPTQFRIRHLLVATTVLAVVFATARMLGESGIRGILLISYLFAPSIAFVLSRYGTTRAVRYRIAAAFLLIMICICFFMVLSVSTELAKYVLFVTAILWLPHIAFVYLVQAAWKSGLRSAGVDPNAVLVRRSDPSEMPHCDRS